MSYQTGTITSAAELVTAVQSFAVANGWALAGGVLSKGGAYIRITSPSVGEVRIESARAGVFSTPDICPRYSKIGFTTWPTTATYHLAAFNSPDTVWLTMNYATTDHAHLGFGNLQKYGGWPGGQWFHAQHSQNPSCIDDKVYSMVDGDGNTSWGTESGCALFWGQKDGRTWDGFGIVGKPSYLHCELRGYIWEATIAATDQSTMNMIHCPSILTPIHKYNPNAFNGQTVLTPFELFLQNTDGNYMSIGHVGHLRFMKLTNYEAGDVLEIGPDKWKVFPWHRIDRTLPNGDKPGYSSGVRSTGVLGVAVRYDGP